MIRNHDDAEVVGLHRGMCFRLSRREVLECSRHFAVNLAGQHGRVLGMRVDFVLPEFSHVEARKDEHACHDHAGQRTDRVEGLCEIETPRSGFPRAHGKNVRVGAGFEEGEAECQYVKPDQEDVEVHRHAGRDGHQCAGRVERQADHDARLE
jgi:hypothetical protein